METPREGARTLAEQAKQKGKGAQEDTFVLVERVTSPFLVLFHKPHSLLAEQYRALRNNILAMNRSGSPRTILVTSAMAGEGKTVTLANLGLAMGEVERNRVLLVDADIRHPGLEAFLGLNREPGLTELLLDRASLEEVIYPSGFPQVDILGAGREVDHPAGLLSGSRMGELFSALKERYRYVLIDSPPILPITDGLTLAPLVDGTLLVVRLDYTPKPAVNRALDQLKKVGAPVLGAFLTCARGDYEGRKSPYYYPYQSDEEGRP